MEILEKEFEFEKDSKIDTKLEEEKLNLSCQNLLDNLKLEDNDYSDFLVLILRVNYKNDFTRLNMYGLNALDYILNAVNFCETKVVDYKLEDDIIKTIKANLNNKKYVAVVFSDTPLITRKTFNEILDYFKFKSLCALKFNRGYVFESDYLLKVEKVYNPHVQSFCEEDFLRVSDTKSFADVLSVLKNRILSYHLSNGVIIKDINSTFIDAEVNIDSGVILENNVILQNKTVIKENAKLLNCKIKNSIVFKYADIENSILENAIIEENVKICDYSVIKNVTITKDSKIENKNIVG
jgi:NDP-sugar pyrophosphorylase family protein